ncbi:MULTISPECIES: alpha-L-fucosidase [Metabacillus]|uniref:alpha-L-fucosidase n=2 Tax=Metabacillus TaxID=2675233 RepID=A0A179T9H5_9BACI|nr:MULTISPECIES: alpha-L-fucosidase [Metabacillus]OAS89083.1 alpha-L-fucosidase [Metabacillus litoralis]QNF28599.1 alpha-L-fucosidase [Metabacillus sp. KUDC1714]
MIDKKYTNYLKEIDRVIKEGKYDDNWDSLSKYELAKWYRDAKFGIFIHWGVYSVPAFGSEWYSRNMYIQGSKEFEHHVKTYGNHKEFGYKDFIPLFKAERFDPVEWADLFKEAGARYVMPVAEHHDGFQMYKSDYSHFNAYEMGPQRDILGELGDSLEERDISLCASSHRIEHWFFMGHGKEFDSDIKEPLEKGDFYWAAMPEPNHQDLFSPSPSEEFLEDWLIRTCEIVDRYRPKIMYFDWWIQHHAVKPYLKKFAAYYYNRADEWGMDVAINYKHDAFMFGSAVVDIERGQFSEQKPYFWQTDTSVAKNSWCYTENNDYKTANEIICDLVDIVSKNGSLLLNIGPKADGTIPDEDKTILLEIGNWLKVNGEAIYDSKVWRKSGEGPTEIQEGQFTDSKSKEFTSEDIRFTVNGSYLYATVLNYPEDGKVNIQSLAEKDASKLPHFHGIIKNISILGFEEKPSWNRTEDGLEITTDQVSSDKPVVFKLLID